MDLTTKGDAPAGQLAPAPRFPPAEPRPRDPAEPPEPADLTALYAALRPHCDADFARYKQAIVLRRVRRRMRLRHCESLDRYAALVAAEPDEARALVQDLLLRAAQFFRDAETCTALKNVVFPRALAARHGNTAIRVWVPGCGSGEDVYSIAICLVETLEEHGLDVPFRIFGTDVDGAALEAARTGLYAASIKRDLSPRRLERFFNHEDGLYRVALPIRAACTFGMHDVTRDAAFSGLHVISCRNLLHHLEPPVQQRVLQGFHAALGPAGALLLGPGETAASVGGLFDPVENPYRRIYAARAGAGPEAPPAGIARPRRRSGRSAALRAADALAARRYAPPSVVCDAHAQVLELRGALGDYLVPAASGTLLDMARPGLLPALATALQASTAGGEACSATARLAVGGQLRTVSIEASPLAARRGGYRLVTFQAGAMEPPRRRPSTWSRFLDVLRPGPPQAPTPPAALPPNPAPGPAPDPLAGVRQQLETSVEALRVANGELQRRNADLELVNARLLQARDYADAIVQNAHEPLLLLSDELLVVRANDAFYRFFLVQPGAIEGRALGLIGDGEWDDPALRRSLTDILAGHGDSASVELAANFAGIGPRTLCLNLARLAWPERAPLLLAIDDMTERRARLAEFESAARRKDEFLAMLAHELRGPLGPMRNALTILQLPQAGAAAVGKAIAVLDRQLEKSARVVDDLLQVADLTSSGAQVRKVRVDLPALLAQVCGSMQPQVANRGHTLTLDLGDESIEVEGDPVRLDQVFSNLLANAIKYTEPGGRLELGLARDGDHAVVRTSDDGIGISTDLLPVVFELFVQETRAPDRAQGGLGIGLSVVRRITELHGGTVEAISPGRLGGSDLVVRLPALAAPQPKAARDPLTEPPRFAPLRILVVDDNVDSAQVSALMLRLEGHDIRSAYDGPSALALADAFDPQVVLLDIGLPGMDGYEVARRLRAGRCGTRVQLIAVSGYGSDRDTRLAMAAGFDHHLVKPASMRQLREVIGRPRPATGTGAPAAPPAPTHEVPHAP